MSSPASNVTIRLDNESETYESGQAITGRVHIKTDIEEEIKGVTIHLEGKATVHQFTNDDDSDDDGQYIKNRHANSPETSVVYVEMKNYYKLGSNSIGQIFKRGETSYSFKFQLPDRNLPCSFTGKYGKVEYVIRVIVERSFWNLDYNARKVIFVHTVVDLNMDPDASLPGDWTCSKTFGFLCCASKPMSLNVKVGKRGYVAGELISADVKLDNLSTRRVNNIVAKLVQESRYVSTDHERKFVKVLCTRKWGECVEAGESGEWQVQLTVPQVEPTGLGGCKIIDVKYFLKVEAHVFGIVFNLKQDCGVIIGTVPLREDVLGRSDTTSTLVLDGQGSLDESGSKTGLYPDLVSGEK